MPSAKTYSACFRSPEPPPPSGKAAALSAHTARSPCAPALIPPAAAATASRSHCGKWSEIPFRQKASAFPQSRTRRSVRALCRASAKTVLPSIFHSRPAAPAPLPPAPSVSPPPDLLPRAYPQRLPPALRRQKSPRCQSEPECSEAFFPDVRSAPSTTVPRLSPESLPSFHMSVPRSLRPLPLLLLLPVPLLPRSKRHLPPPLLPMPLRFPVPPPWARPPLLLPPWLHFPVPLLPRLLRRLPLLRKIPVPLPRSLRHLPLPPRA